MNTVWGPKVWAILHRLSFYSNRKDICAAWKQFLKVLSNTIPCALCRKHMKEYLIRYPLVFNDMNNNNIIRNNLVVWLYDFHNHVNKSLGKEIFPFELLEIQYGQGMYEVAVKDAKQIMSDLEHIWSRVNMRDLKIAFGFLCGLINGGPL